MPNQIARHLCEIASKRDAEILDFKKSGAITFQKGRKTARREWED